MSETVTSSRTAPTSAVAVSVQDLSVTYRVYEEPILTAREFVRRGLRGRRTAEVQALRGVTFDVGVGEAVGIVGTNGSGKSTLLRAVAGLQSKQGGKVLVRGEVQLLGVGAALRPQLSGYRNVMLGGLAMGLEPDVIEAQLDEIAEFSGLGRAMTRPMKTYSSGMRARLAFSIATLRVPDVLLIDEALAVGDKDFRQRSLDRIKEIRDSAGTVLMVTHNLGEIRQTCSRVIWLADGVIVQDGDTASVIDAYRES